MRFRIVPGLFQSGLQAAQGAFPRALTWHPGKPWAPPQRALTSGAGGRIRAEHNRFHDRCDQWTD
jgi:hypothetical protein